MGAEPVPWITACEVQDAKAVVSDIGDCRRGARLSHHIGLRGGTVSGVEDLEVTQLRGPVVGGEGTVEHGLLREQIGAR